MYTKLYDFLVPKIGHDAAKKALNLQYANLGLVITGVAGIIISYTGDVKSWTVINILIACLIIATAVNVFFRLKFAEALSERLRVKVRWLELPNFTPLSKLESWLESLSDRPKV